MMEKLELNDFKEQFDLLVSEMNSGSNKLNLFLDLVSNLNE